ncbi:hypothetical protein LZ32DRAFT_319522 [Colletotrichum eremochloae]|nr:hypothetical protein LZ32DRAFT_319522 [Colletotrichum eremochloae]
MQHWGAPVQHLHLLQSSSISLRWLPIQACPLGSVSSPHSLHLRPPTMSSSTIVGFKTARRKTRRLHDLRWANQRSASAWRARRVSLANCTTPLRHIALPSGCSMRTNGEERDNLFLSSLLRYSIQVVPLIEAWSARPWIQVR